MWYELFHNFARNTDKIKKEENVRDAIIPMIKIQG